MLSLEGPAPHRKLWPDLVNHLRHRGPDAAAFWADGPFFLGHRRLAILGLVSGDQPMATSDGRLVVTLNGQIYNYLELKEELEGAGHRFRTDSDTEVLLHGYREWGDALPTRLTGMFAFAIADRERRRLFLARDRFGEKPLFVLRTPTYVAFASEVRPLAALPGYERRLDLEALGGYLSLNYVAGDRTLLEGVRRLEPGSWTSFTSEREESQRYWSPPTRAVERSLSIDAALEEWRPLFDRAVRLAMRSDVPVGILLSGGMDSSLVAESAVRQGKLSCAYFLDFEESGWSERAAAEAVATRLGLPVESATLSEQALADFPLLVEHADDPLADSSALAVHTIARRAALGNKVVLGGDGGDELFGGYLTYQASRTHAASLARAPRLLRRGLASAAVHMPVFDGKVTWSYRLMRFLRAAALPTEVAHFTWNGTWLPEEAELFALRGGAGEALPRLAERLGLADSGGSRRFQLADVREYLPNDILVKMDRMSMAHGLETRAPFLEHELAAWALALPEQLTRGAGRQLKRLLRSAARASFGSEIADRPKQGFSIPVHRWVRGPLSETVRDLLSPQSVERLGVIDSARVTRTLEDHLAGRRLHGFELWGLAVLAAWHRARIERAPSDPVRDDVLERRFERQ